MKKLAFVGDTYIELPENMEEVTFRQYLDLLECDNDEIKAVSVLTNISKLDWAQSERTDVFYYCREKLFGSGSWLVKGLNEIVNAETGMMVLQSQSYKFDDLGKETVAQFEDLRKLVDMFTKKYQTSPVQAMREYYPTMCAIYLQPKASGKKYDYSEAIKLNDQILNMPCTVVIGITNFFLARYAVSMSGMGSNVPKASSLWKRWMRGLAFFTARLVFRRHSTRLRGEISKRKITLKG